ncbi:MAG: polyhydroxyalkanoate synthesis repressor PhaR [Rhodospirillales bacterium]|nr:polyhydroxyalkanoate synthesis repressor PhaR [Alphaproteobacteria bacterium]USO06029.1 MAG: polyhydroxyalkanoate synthesis repressor PhaR [Rhodospirillales bacterium]
MAKGKNGQDNPTVIKKYANRRLYDTGRSSYVTLDDLCEMVKDGIDFVVYDAKSGTDITRSVLTQIIVEQESKGENLLPTGFLKNLIGFYGDNIQSIVPNYLEQTLDTFVKNQEQVREQINKSFEGINPIQNMFPPIPGSADFEEMSRKNMEMFENTMKMFMPFNADYTEQDPQKKQK